MCVPPQAAMAIASAGAEFMEYQAEVENYDNAIATNARNRISAVNARDIQISQAQLKNEQEQGALADKRFQNALEAAKNSETYKTAAGEDNIIGRSIDQALGMRIAQGLRNDTKFSVQSNMVSDASEMDAMEIQARLEGRLAQIVDPNPPSAAAAMFGMATSAASGYGSLPSGTTWGEIFS
tara:strand:+ start:1061 stop:1603 length:543 start_codon:yes stop_codon:yes gene_type:complete